MKLKSHVACTIVLIAKASSTLVTSRAFINYNYKTNNNKTSSTQIYNRSTLNMTTSLLMYHPRFRGFLKMIIIYNRL